MATACARVLQRLITGSIIAIGISTPVVGCSVTLDPTFRADDGQPPPGPGPNGAAGEGGAGGRGGGNAGGGGAGGGGTGGGGTGGGGTGGGGAGVEDGGTDPGDSGGEPSPATFPGSVSDGLVLWLDAGFAESLELDTGRVVGWGDRSGNDFSVTQADPDAQPSLVEGAIASNAVVRFDGSSDVLEGSTLEPLDDYDVFVVWQSTVEPPANQTHLLRNGPSLEINHGHDQPTFRYAGASQFEATWVPAQFEPPVTDTVYIWNLSLDSTTGTLTAITNGSISATANELAGRTLGSSEPLTVGSRWGLARHFTGDIGEILIYSRPLEATERSAVQSYLDDKWRP